MLNRLEMLRIFCVAAESHSFKEAAQRLRISPQAVTRAIKELEDNLGELLFYRNTRKTQITDFGEQLALQAQASIQGIDHIFRKQNGEKRDDISGKVCITAPEVLGELYLMPLLAKVLEKHPGLQFDLRLLDQESSVIDEKIDVGIRLGFMRDSRFVARTITQIPFYIVGSPSLIKRVGIPKTPDELNQLPVTAVMDRSTGKAWPWFFDKGQQWQPKSPVVFASDIRTERSAVLSGMGFGQMPGFMVLSYLKTGQLISILPEFSPEPWNFYVYRPQQNPVPARTRVVFDALVQGFSDSAFFRS